ncbi:MAG: GTP cyclohydrolase I FolE2 [Solirubrobacterales bacterium]|nr:GTP cyclohydrolase I FolE2 [Solirubrobacterales bacterium]MBV9535023.1 GTP cyclohydrolase I FolE2 [Solirubrobacterales bacterium]
MAFTHATELPVADVQARRPAVQVSLSRAGVTGVEKVIRLRQNGAEQLFSARFECVVDLGPEQKGAHMSRFEEVINDVIGEVVLNETTFKAETIVQHIAEQVRERQGARRAEVSVEARFPEHKPAPVSDIRTQELYTLHGSAVSSQLGTRRLIGVTAQGMTACPCAQELVAKEARARLEADAFTAEEIQRILAAVPIATHNQRGLGTLHIGCTELCEDEIDAATLLEIVEGAMSSEIYELMKRSDEASVVEKAHRRPRFVEDCVREMVLGVLKRFPGLDDRAFVCARQVNLETIHQHNVVAERFGTLAEIRRELDTGVPPPVHTTRRVWLDHVPEREP